MIRPLLERVSKIPFRPDSASESNRDNLSTKLRASRLPSRVTNDTNFQLYVTKVTFTVGPIGPRMGMWFGSSGGGLPEAP